MPPPDDDETAALRAEWRAWMGARLPAAAHDHPDWPIRLDHCFGRVILDAVYGRPWREAIAAPAWRHMDADALRRAVALARDIAEDRADLAALNAASLRGRGKAQGVEARAGGSAPTSSRRRATR